ncbi:hypothetical protein RFI_29309, partial [Reticulomyxa filosa]
MSRDQEFDSARIARKEGKIFARARKKGQQMMDAMAKRRLNRTHQSDKQQNRQVDAFDAEFNNEMDKIESELEKKDNTFEKFKELKMQAFQLESKLASAAKFLPNYTFERKSKQIQQLKDKITQTQQNVLNLFFAYKHIYKDFHFCLYMYMYMYIYIYIYKYNKVAPRPKFRLNRVASDKPTTNSGNEIKEDNNSKVVPSTSDTTNKTIEKTEIVSAASEERVLQGNTDEVIISNLCNEEIEKIHGTINGKDVWLSDLKNCKIRICDHIGALRMNNIHSCTIITGPITTSLHVENISNSE